MGKLKVGDIVARKSYGQDICFRISEILEENEECKVTLKGISYRLEADAPESDLVVMDEIKDNKVKSGTLYSKKTV